ncbi:MAG: hypothetical protein IPP72_05115 [Chitinophagaceae bacterium]|nr:hypothetical protein [Chitinophagaceae bacterium]
MNGMQSPSPAKYKIVYQWLSYCLLFGFVYYWLFSIGLIFFNKSIHKAAPGQTAFYYAFWRQNWRLFAFTKVYNRELNFIVRDKSDLAKADTVDLVKYFIAEKRHKAPFNNYDDGLDQMLYWIMNGLETQLYQKQQQLKEQFPGRPDSFYMRQSNMLVLSDSLHQDPLQNLTSFGKFVLKRMNKDTVGKEFQLLLRHKFIPPQKPPAGSVSNGDERTIFILPFKPF